MTASGGGRGGDDVAGRGIARRVRGDGDDAIGVSRAGRQAGVAVAQAEHVGGDAFPLAGGG